MASMFQEVLETTEDVVYYWLFPHDKDWMPITDEDQLQNLISEYMASLCQYIQGYIWNNEPFSLSVHSQSSVSNSVPIPCIRGKTVVGDYLEDEWFVVFLLTKLTKTFTGLISRVYDSDGEFILIEAASHIPAWANPESAECRVYLREGLVHLVPPTILPLSSDSSSPEIAMTAVGHVAHVPQITRANPSLQSDISRRIQEYPRKISREHHTTHAFMPVGVAALLHEYPTLVSASIRAFCNRDALDNKCLRVMKHFPPETRVMTSVRFSKALYAQLAAHPYTPDKRTGWNIPPQDNNSHVIGMKLACGFEILVCSAGGLTPSAGTPLEDINEGATLDNNPIWMKYRNSLLDNGYFRGEMEGSKLFRELEANAHRYFMANNMTTLKGSDENDTLSVGSVIVKLLSKVNPDYDGFKKKEKSLRPPDDENWLQMDPEAFDSMLESKFMTTDEASKKKTDEEIAETLNAFLKHTSSYEGAEIPEELRPQKPPRKSSSERKSSTNRKFSGLNSHLKNRKISSNSNASDSSEMSSFSSKIEFHGDSFSEALHHILELDLPEDNYFVGADDNSSGMSSYEDDDEGEVSLNRKISDGSTGSKASSGVEVDVAPPQRPRRKKSSKSSKKIPLASFDDFLEDSDEGDDKEAVAQLMKNYKQEGGVGPTTSLLASLGINAHNK